jgi:ribonucleoside-diphosphate reductase beta chain
MSYPWAYEFWETQQKIHWLPEEVPLQEDVRDWNTHLSDEERNLLTQLFRFFTQGDVDVSEGYVEKYLPKFQMPELRMMLLAFANMETVHIDAYALLLETIGMPESEYEAFKDIEEMAEKHEFVTQGAGEMVKGFSKEQKAAFDIAIFSAFTEGLHLFSSFIILMNFARFGKMKGMGQIVTWSVRDESLHVEGMMKIFHTIVEEHPEIWTQTFENRLRDICRRMVDVEFAFIDRAFEMGGIEGLTPEEVKEYVKYIADRRMLQLGTSPVYGVKDNPLPWVTWMMGGVEHANFFETRATEYSKGGVKGNWNEDIWA